MLVAATSPVKGNLSQSLDTGSRAWAVVLHWHRQHSPRLCGAAGKQMRVEPRTRLMDTAAECAMGAWAHEGSVLAYVGSYQVRYRSMRLHACTALALRTRQIIVMHSRMTSNVLAQTSHAADRGDVIV